MAAHRYLPGMPISLLRAMWDHRCDLVFPFCRVGSLDKFIRSKFSSAARHIWGHVLDLDGAIGGEIGLCWKWEIRITPASTDGAEFIVYTGYHT